MNVLIACEESQTVCKAFRAKGHEAYSCDIQPCSGGHPEWHLQDDVLKHLEGWDLIIAHPPCTYLTVAGNRHFDVSRYGQKAIGRINDRIKAAEFFMQIVNAPCDHIAIENPVGYMNTHYRKPDQIIQPYYFGHPVSKNLFMAEESTETGSDRYCRAGMYTQQRKERRLFRTIVDRQR